MLLALRVGGFRPGFPLLWDPNEGAGVITGDPNFAVPNNALVRPVNFFTPGVYRFDFTPNFVPTDALHVMVKGFQLHWQALAVAFAAMLCVALQVAITSITATCDDANRYSN
eukprot:9598-Heterococcus_DN1.PRE.1